MDSSGEQHLQIDHSIHKIRLDLNGNPIAEPKKEEIATAKTVMVSDYCVTNAIFTAILTIMFSQLYTHKKHCWMTKT